MRSMTRRRNRPAPRGRRRATEALGGRAARRSRRGRRGSPPSTARSRRSGSRRPSGGAPPGPPGRRARRLRRRSPARRCRRRSPPGGSGRRAPGWPSPAGGRSRPAPGCARPSARMSDPRWRRSRVSRSVGHASTSDPPRLGPLGQGRRAFRVIESGHRHGGHQADAQEDPVPDRPLAARGQGSRPTLAVVDVEESAREHRRSRPPGSGGNAPWSAQGVVEEDEGEDRRQAEQGDDLAAVASDRASIGETSACPRASSRPSRGRRSGRSGRRRRLRGWRRSKT